MKKSARKAVGVGAGAAAVAALAAAAGIYLLSGKEGKARRSKAKAWILKAEKDVARRTAGIRKFGEAEYKRIVVQAVKKYGRLENMSAADVARITKSITAGWAAGKKAMEQGRRTKRKHPSPKKRA